VTLTICPACGGALECYENEVYCPDCTRFEPAAAPWEADAPDGPLAGAGAPRPAAGDAGTGPEPGRTRHRLPEAHDLEGGPPA
jgi:hypothetical protein